MSEITSVDRNIPLRPSVSSARPSVSFRHVCPSCGKGLLGYPFCQHCGQAIDWDLPAGFGPSAIGFLVDDSDLIALQQYADSCDGDLPSCLSPSSVKQMLESVVRYVK